MDQLFDLAAWREILVRAFSELSTTVAGFIPNLVGAALILAVGWMISRALEAVSVRAMRTVGVDRVATRLRIAEYLERAEVPLSLSQVVARLLFWVVLLTFLLSSMETLGLSAVTITIDRLIAFIPGVIGAALIVIAGLLFARFVAALVSSSASVAGFANASRFGFLVQIAVAGLVIVVAIEQVGVETDILILPLSVVLASAGFAVGLAFALGARPVVTHILAGHFLKRSLPREASVEIGGRRGFVDRVGAIDTLLRGDDGSWTIPNAQLLDEIVVR